MTIKNIITLVWSLRHQFMRYFCVGFSAFIFDIGSLMLLKEIVGWPPILAVVANQVFILTYIFLLNKYWSFNNRDLPHRQMVRFLVLVACNYTFSVTTMFIFNHLLALDYRLVRICTIAFAAGFNFFTYRYWVYKTKTPSAEVSSP